MTSRFTRSRGAENVANSGAQVVERLMPSGEGV